MVWKVRCGYSKRFSPEMIRPGIGLREMGCLPPDTEETAPFTEQELTAAVSDGDHWLTDNQYGFRQGTGTDNALHDVLETIGAATDKYVMGVFLDISGAFDNVWWPEILCALRRMQCPRNLFLLVTSYFADRKGVMVKKTSMVEKVLTKGCPQGSVLGPLFWNILFDSFLCLPMPDGCRALAASHRAKLLRVQRAALLAVTKAYRTVSTDALQVIPGIAPMDLRVIEVGKLALTRVNGQVEPQHRRVAWEKVMEDWHERWSASEKGRVAFTIFPCVRERLKLDFVLGHQSEQFLSGHGNFKAKLYEMGLVDDPQCDDCLVPHTMAHILHDCVCIEDLREILKWKLSLLGLDFDLAVIKAADSDAKALLSEFARKAMRRLSVGNRARDERLAADPLQPDSDPETV
ncbi:hypothetical protein PR048_031913 [Dryococelus australis]|uniref:Reverse transcriptase domain-containing protein n=1 Tax=Dryococelus australis TaxID=614101 RepID=A0ABQ9G6M6_9NEOP|nr:hypothetical protein PR048_031913 [Dryococelus australis]